MIFGSSPTMRNDRLVPSVHAILQSGNLYLFTMHNPVNFTDPSGLFAIPIHAVFNPIAKVAKKLVAKLTNKPAVQNTAQQASQTVQQTQQVTQAARGSVPAAQQAATPITRYAPQVTQQATQATQQAVKQTVTRRDVLLNSVQNPALKRTVNELYRPNASTWDGGTAAALRYEFQTGQSMTHLTKAMERITNLQKIIKNENLSASDLAIANNLLSDLQNAVSMIIQ